MTIVRLNNMWTAGTVLTFALSTQAIASSTTDEAPPGVVAPPFEHPILRPPIQAAVVVRGVVQSDHSAGSLEPTSVYLEHMTERFTGWPDQSRQGLWNFHMVRIRVDEVLRAEQSYADLKPGTIVDLYVDAEVGIGGANKVGSEEVVVFMEPYSHRRAGAVSPYSQKEVAFVLSERNVTNAIVGATNLSSPCPGKARNESGELILRLSTTSASLEFLLARGGGELQDESYVSSDTFSCDGIGFAAVVNENLLDSSPWSCDDFVDFSSLKTVILTASIVGK